MRLTALACLLAMTACSSTHSTPPTDVACQTFRPIAYDSREIPPDLTRQIREYHAVLLRLCPERERRHSAALIAGSASSRLNSAA
jgi:hypothetical protein